MNKVSIWLGAILCTIALATPATANVIASTSISVTSPEGGFVIASDQQSLASGTARADRTEPFSEFSGFGYQGTASASYGTLKGFSLVANGSTLEVMAFTRSSFEDILSVVIGDGIFVTPGTPGFLDIRVAYNWSFRAPIADALISLAFPGGEAIAASGITEPTPLSVSGTAQAIDAVLGDFFIVRVPFASADALSVSLNFFTTAIAEGPGFAIADASQSAYWGGIVAVRDSDLNIVPFSVTSASGTNYRGSFVPGEEVPTTVPEPTSVSLLCGGFVFLLSRKVRRGGRLVTG